MTPNRWTALLAAAVVILAARPSAQVVLAPTHNRPLSERVQGEVRLDIVVAVDGTVAAGRVVQSLRPSLDAEALDAVSQWRFTAGHLLGKPVPVRMTVTVPFRTR